jgi:uncharacterized protein (TIGR02246 family)
MSFLPLPWMLPGLGMASASAHDEAAVRAIIDSETEAWNVGDAKAYSAHFAEGGSFTNIVGMVFYGREAFESKHVEVFATIFKGSRLKQTIRKLRFVTPDVAIADTDGEVTGFAGLGPGVQAWPDGVLRVRLQQVFVKRSGAWWIEAYHNVDAKVLPPRP